MDPRPSELRISPLVTLEASLSVGLAWHVEDLATLSLGYAE